MNQILIIDDDPAIQLLLKRTLKSQGYDVTVASDGEVGLANAQELRPALVICDWVMPRMNGLEVCRAIKTNSDLSTTFFILLTSLGSVEDRVKGLDAGADDFLCKPIEMNELKARVRAGLRLHQLNQDLTEQKQILEAELAEAAEYVRSILPDKLTEPPVAIDVRFIPSRQLGGDSFDYFWLDEEHLAMYLLDVAGHGLRAALPSISVMNLLRSRALPKVDYYQPQEVLTGLNETFQITERNDKYFTIWYGVYHKTTRQLTYASAGHPPGVLVTHKLDAAVEKLKTPGLPIGMFPDPSYSQNQCIVAQGSTLYIFSDGIYELIQPDGLIWGLDNFIQVLAGTTTPTGSNLDQVLIGVGEMNPEDDFEDDVSLLGIHFV